MLDAAKTRLLPSFLAGEWRTGTGAGTTVEDATTGLPVARLDTTGLDIKAALAYGRDTGGPGLRAMRIHERALMMKALGLRLLELKEEFYALSTATGATRSDSWIDQYSR